MLNYLGFFIVVWTVLSSRETLSSPTPDQFGPKLLEKVKAALEALSKGREENYLLEITHFLSFLKHNVENHDLSPNSTQNGTTGMRMGSRSFQSNSESLLLEGTRNHSPNEGLGSIANDLVRKLADVVKAVEGEFANGTLNMLRPGVEKGAGKELQKNQTKHIESELMRNGTSEATEEIDYEAMGCGVKNMPPVQARILGGEVAANGEWPWQVALVRASTGKAFCGASLLNTRFLLTAGHCAFILPARSIQAWLGSHVLSRHREKHRVVRGISHVVIHDGFMRRNLKNDIALLRMDEPVRLSRNIRPVCMPDVQEWDENLFNGTDKQRMGVVAGWGLTKEKGKRSPVLLQVRLPFLNVSECKKRYERINPVTDKMLCTLHNSTAGPPRDSCKGDSGGPLVTVGAQGRWTQVGVVSFGYGCGREGYPAVYTRVTQYLLWIYLKIVQTEISIMP